MRAAVSFCRRLGALGVWLPIFASIAAAQGLTLDEALAVRFPPPARVERRSATLTDAQLDTARRLAGEGVPIMQRIVTYYAAFTGATMTGTAYFDRHRVRTMDEVVMVVVGADDRVRGVEILRFGEPPEYRAPAPWLSRLNGLGLDGRLATKSGVPNLSGATLTANAITQTLRRVLALHELVRPFRTP